MNNVVPRVGLEPTRYCYQRILSPLRLPFRHPGNKKGKREKILKCRNILYKSLRKVRILQNCGKEGRR